MPRHPTSTHATVWLTAVAVAGALAFVPATSDAPAAIDHVAVDDVDGDGVQDLLIVLGDAGAGLLRMRSGRDGAVLWEQPLSSGSRVDVAAVADGNGDGVADVVAVHETLREDRDCEVESCRFDEEVHTIDEVTLLDGVDGAALIGPVEFHGYDGRDHATYVGDTRIERGEARGVRAGAIVARLALGPVVEVLDQDLAPEIGRLLPGHVVPYLVVARGTMGYEVRDGVQSFDEDWDLGGSLVVLDSDGVVTSLAAPEGVAPDAIHLSPGGDDGDGILVGTLDEAGRTEWTPWREGVWSVATSLTTDWSVVPERGGGVPVPMGDLDDDGLTEIGVFDRILSYSLADVQVLSGATGALVTTTEGTMPVASDRMRSISTDQLSNPLAVRVHEQDRAGGPAATTDVLTVEHDGHLPIRDIDGERRDVDGDGVLDILYRVQLYWVEGAYAPTEVHRTAAVAVSGASGEVLSSVASAAGGGLHAEVGGASAIGLVLVGSDPGAVTLTALDGDGTDLWHRDGLPAPSDPFGPDLHDLELVELEAAGASMLAITWHGGLVVLDGATGETAWSG